MPYSLTHTYQITVRGKTVTVEAPNPRNAVDQAMRRTFGTVATERHPAGGTRRRLHDHQLGPGEELAIQVRQINRLVTKEREHEEVLHD